MADYTNLEKIRLEKAQQLKELGINPYPRRVKRTHTIQKASDAFLAIEDDQEKPEDVVSRSTQLQSYVLIGLIVAGILISASVVIYAHLI